PEARASSTLPGTRLPRPTRGRRADEAAGVGSAACTPGTSTCTTSSSSATSRSTSSAQTGGRGCGPSSSARTGLLQTSAAAASGVDRGTQLVSDVVASWPDLRNPVPLNIAAEFGFSETRHGRRRYPGYKLAPPGLVPRLSSTLRLEPDKR